MEETSYTYDDDGQLARTKTIRQPQWMTEDRILALALDTYERSLCSGCGQPRDRAWHPDMDGWYEAEEVICNGCGAIERKAREASAGEGNSTPGRKYYAVDVRPADQPLHPVDPI